MVHVVANARASSRAASDEPASAAAPRTLHRRRSEEDWLSDVSLRYGFRSIDPVVAVSPPGVELRLEGVERPEFRVNVTMNR